MRALLDKNPTYRTVTILRLDWDLYDDAPIAGELGVVGFPTLVGFKEGREITRVIGRASESEIESLFRAVLG